MKQETKLAILMISVICIAIIFVTTVMIFDSKEKSQLNEECQSQLNNNDSYYSTIIDSPGNCCYWKTISEDGLYVNKKFCFAKVET